MIVIFKIYLIFSAISISIQVSHIPEILEGLIVEWNKIGAQFSPYFLTV